MWCERMNFQPGSKERIRDCINYFEGTCEFCLSNMGIQKYLSETERLLEADNDDEAFMLLNYLAGVIHYKLSEMNEAVEYWQKAEIFARKLVNDVFIAKIFSYYSIIFYIEKDYDRSELYFEEAASIFAICGLNTEMALHYVNYLWYKRYDPDKNDVASYLDQAFYYVQKSDSMLNGRVYLHLGYIYKTVFKDFIRGIGYLNTARDICCRNNNVEMESMTLHVLADGYMNFSHYQKAINIYERLMTDPHYRDITENLKCMILQNLIPCYLLTGEYESALMYLDQMQEFIKNTHWELTPGFDCMWRWLKAQYCIKVGKNLDQVLLLLDHCMEFYEERPAAIQVENFRCRLVESYGDYWFEVGNLQKAMEEYLKMEVLAESGSNRDRQAVCNKLARTFEQKGDYETALRYRKQEDGWFFSIDKQEALSAYDELYGKFFRTVHDDMKREFFSSSLGSGKMAYVDELTRLKNKDYYTYFVSRICRKGRFSVIKVDVDFFREYNDVYGRQKGDSCISHVASIIRGVVAEEKNADACDVIRIEDDDFIIMAEDFSEKQGLELAERIVRKIAGAEILNKGSESSDFLTVSAGCTTGSFYTEEDKEKLVAKAEYALGAARTNGRNRAFAF